MGRTPLRQITVAKRCNCTIFLCFEPRAPGLRPTGQGEAGRLPGPPRSPAVLKITPNWDELTPASAGLFFFTQAPSCERDRAGGATRLCANRLAQELSPLCRNRLRPWPSEGLSTPRCSRAAAVKGRGVLHPVKGLPVVHDPAVQAQFSDRNHEHHHGAGHVHAPASFGRAFAIGIGLNVAFVAVEFVFGVLANSVSLLADAGHNLSDVLGLVIAWIASVLVRRPPSSRYTYGLRSSSILAALFNAVFLLVAVGAIA